MMSLQELYTRLKKYRKQECSPEELDALENWYQQFEREVDAIPEVPKEKLDMLFSQIERRILPVRRSPRLFLRTMFRYASGVAAVVSIVAACVLYSMRPQERMEGEQLISVSPGRWQAELVMSDGSRVKLDSSTIVKERDGQLIKGDSVTVLDYSQQQGQVDRNSFNTIVVPKGGEYGIILSDGTRVRLNSGTTLKYPVVFTGEQREVLLSGEAYFDVQKSSKPFIVKTFDLNVKVLGTSFNISAYGEDPCVTTALVKGSVEVFCNHDERSQKLSPGHLLSYTKESSFLTVEECDTDLYTSWTNGKFRFRDMRLEDIMRTLGRWYDCQIEYETNNLKDIRFSGAAEKDHSIDYVLDTIEKITDVDFDVRDSIIVVRNK